MAATCDDLSKPIRKGVSIMKTEKDTPIIPESTDKKQPHWDKIPQEMKELNQWIGYKLIWDEKKQKYNKPPFSLDGKKNQSFDTHYTFEEVKAAVVAGRVDGMGFAMTPNDNLICIDLDGDSLEDIPGELKSISNFSYAEKSPSGNGLHVWFRGDKPKGAIGKQNRYSKKDGYKIECFYDSGYLTVTGDAINDLPIEENQMMLNFIFDSTTHGSEKHETSSVGELQIPVDEKEDALIIEKMFNSRSGDKIKALFNGDTSLHEGDASSADIALCNYLAVHTKCNAEQIDRIFRNTKLMRDKWDVVHHSDGSTYGQETIKRAIAWAYPNVLGTNNVTVKKEENNITDVFQFLIPSPFVMVGNLLKKEVKVKVEGVWEDQVITVCRQAPVITKSYSNVEKSQMYHEIHWIDNGREHFEIVPAGDIAIRRNLLLLADKSLGVNDLNAKDLISFFDKFILFNEKTIPRENLVERLGHIRNGFAHPAMSNLKILPPDIGEKQTLDAFQSKGTAEEWIGQVFHRVKEHPKALLMVLASFTSVILKDLKLSPFIVDLSGPTSRGKTTALKVAASVWGTEHLVSEWNATKVATERKAAFLNSFPLILDDTMKAEERHLKGIIYNFSGGRSKGRGSVAGSQVEYTWNNLLLSTGETSLVEYAKEAGGAAARILPITGLPFENVEFSFFNDIYESIENYHGAIGIEFHKQWTNKKDIYSSTYAKYNSYYQEKSNGNDVLSRISRHYSAIVFTGLLVREFFNVEINFDSLDELFDVMIKENTAVDKPMERLRDILSDLDSDRQSIYGEHPTRGETKALYRDGTLILLPAYLKGYLQTEQSSIRAEWLRREISIPTKRNEKKTDFKQYTHKGSKFSGVAINPMIVEDLGFDFSVETLHYQNEK